MYTYWLVSEFKSIGKTPFISYPFYLHGGKKITIGDNFDCNLRVRLEAFEEHMGHLFTPEIVIGNNVSINPDCHIGAINKIEIGDNVLMASKVFITDHYHGEITSEAINTAPSKRKLFSKGPVIIENNVWLGEGVVVLPGVTIGENSIIGANSVVTKNIPRNSVVGGNPARIIRTL
ncbi:MAG: acyltransferase [Bacteroidales bacterium]|nr:acyltransferase [Bacteroidales bacterium]